MHCAYVHTTCTTYLFLDFSRQATTVTNISTTQDTSNTARPAHDVPTISAAFTEFAGGSVERDGDDAFPDNIIGVAAVSVTVNTPSGAMSAEVIVAAISDSIVEAMVAAMSVGATVDAAVVAVSDSTCDVASEEIIRMEGSKCTFL